MNHYLHYINRHSNGLCDHCGIDETVNHFLIDCPGFADSPFKDLHKNNMDFNIFRNQLKKRLKKQSIFFKNPRNFTSINLLFPHLWQLQPNQDNPNYKEILNQNIQRRVEILRLVVRFVRDTKRFNNQFKY